jgi:hypothetical protein
MYFSSFLIVLFLGIVSADLLVPVKKIEKEGTTDYVTTDLMKLDNTVGAIEENVKNALKTKEGDELNETLKTELTTLINVVSKTTRRHQQLRGPFRKSMRHANNALRKLNAGQRLTGNDRYK